MSKLKIAIQKSGRLKEDSLKLLNDCGIIIDNGRDQLKTVAANFPLEVFYLRNSDIPQYVQDGVVDVAIVGENLLIEKKAKLPIVRKLGFSKCRVSLAVPKNTEVDDIQFYNNKRIATSYPTTLSTFLKANNLTAEVHKISGSVEIAPTIGLADAILDIVSSGNTLFKNGLKETEVVLKSEAVLVQSANVNEATQLLIDKLNFRLKAVLEAKLSNYILMNVPNTQIKAVSQILPVLKSPTILPLAEEGWSSLHSVIKKDDFWNVIDQLKKLGAEGILVAPIEKMVI